MNKNYYNSIKIVFLLSFVLIFSGCDTIADLQDWISDFYNAYIADIGCWMLSTLISTINLLGGAVGTMISSLLLLLPTVTLPTINLEGNEILQYTAYFFPLAETATLIKALIGFYLSFYIGRIVLRWLKVIK